jgi:subtilisin family serine protease
MEVWLGYSAQGPGQTRLTTQKPDFCAPSQFRDTNDAALLNTGTSAACAMAAGVLALLRSRWDSNVVSPTDMKSALISSARPIRPVSVEGPTYRMGAGILNIHEAIARLQCSP